MLRTVGLTLGRFINYVMKDGKKSTAERLVYTALDKVREITKEDPIAIFEKALENASPMLEVSRSVSAVRTIKFRWKSVRSASSRFRSVGSSAPRARKKGKGWPIKFAEELVAASKNEGNAIKKKLDMHRMAEANRAFAHFAR